MPLTSVPLTKQWQSFGCECVSFYLLNTKGKFMCMCVVVWSKIETWQCSGAARIRIRVYLTNKVIFFLTMCTWTFKTWFVRFQQMEIYLFMNKVLGYIESSINSTMQLNALWISLTKWILTEFSIRLFVNNRLFWCVLTR